MTSKGKQFYDREDLDDEEQKLFDEMVLEEMEKLENQFKESSVNDGRRDQRPLTLNLDTICDDGQEDSTLSSAHNRSNEYNTSQRAEPRYEKSNTSIASATVRSDDQPARRAPRISLVADNFPRPKQNTSFNSSESFVEDNQEQQLRREASNLDSRSPIQDPHQPTRRYRRGDSSPDSRVVSNISLIGAGDSSVVSPSQKREQQAKYAMQLAESAASSRSARTQVDNYVSKPSRRASAEMNMDEASSISQIGQDSQQLKERRKMQQLEYAQQLSNQQSQRHHQNNSPVLDESPRSHDSGMHSARGGSSSYGKDGSPTGNRSGMVNFGTDPAVEAAKKRETKAAYGRQLLEQQNIEQDMKSQRGSRSDSFRDNSVASPRYTGHDSREEERNAARSAAEMKREQQRKYRDEISSAASAAPIMSARSSLQGGTGTGSGLESGPGSGLPRKRGDTDAYSRSNGSGLSSGNALSFLSSADAERLEARSKKVQLQQMYAKQLTEDSAAVSLSGTNISRTGSSSGVRSSLPASRRASTESDDLSADSRGVRPASGNSVMYAVNNDGRDGRGMFDPMSEKDQLAMAAAKKKASQMEYYQQLQDADNRRPDPSVQSSQRVTLYRSRDQQEQEGVPIGRYRDDNTSRQSSFSMQNGSYPQRGQGESSGYQGQAYSMGAGPGLSSRTSASDSRSMEGDSGDGAYARKKQQEEYARALRSDAEAGAIPDSYTAQRRSHHDREGPGNVSGGSRTHVEEKYQERELDRYQERGQGRYPARESDARHLREIGSELDGYSVRQHERNNSREQALNSQRGREREREGEQTRYQPHEQEMHHNSRIASGRHDKGDLDPDPHIDNYSYNHPHGNAGYDSSAGPIYNGGQGTNEQYGRVSSSRTTSRGNELVGGAGSGAGQRDGDRDRDRERGRQEDRGQGAGYSNGHRGDTNTDSGYINEESGPKSRYSPRNDPSNQSYHPQGPERERQYGQNSSSPRPISGSNPGPNSSNRQGQPQSQEMGQYQAAPQRGSHSQPGGNLSQRDIAPAPVSVPVSGRGRSSGGGASSISLYG